MAEPGASGSGYSQQDPSDSSSDWAARQFQIWQTLSRVRTMIMVEVTAVNGGAGAVAAPGTVSVKPLVKIIDGQGNVSSHEALQNIQVFRLGSKFGSIILDPEVGDVGWMAVADRDSSVVVKTSGKESQPGSRRMFNLADGVYMGMLFGGNPTQYVRFTDQGIQVVDKNNNQITTTSAGVEVKDVNNNEIATSSSGVVINAAAGTFELEDKNGNKVQSSAAGITWTDVSANNLTLNSAGISINGINFNRSRQITTDLSVQANLTVGVGNLIVTNSLYLGGAILNVSGGEYSGNLATSGTLTASDAILAGVQFSQHEHQYLLATGSPTSPAQTSKPV